MFRISLSDGLAVSGIIVAVVLVALDKADKLKGPLPLILLAVAALMTLPLALGNSWVSEAPSVIHRVFRSMTMLFIVGLSYSVLVNWILPEKPAIPDESLDNTIVAECTRGLMPNIVPPEGTINTIQLHPTGGKGNRTGHPGDKWEWLGNGKEQMQSYRCSIKNYGKSPVSDITIIAKARFMENIKTETGARSGDMKHTFDYQITIPALKADALDEYKFYMYNGSPFYVNVEFSEDAFLRKFGDEKRTAVKLKPYADLMRVMFFPPIEWETPKVQVVPKSGEKEISDKKIESLSINAPGNTGIITQGQSGGSNTIINQSDSPRRLTAEQSAKIENAAKSSCEAIGHISVTADSGNHEAKMYAMDFVKAFKAAGCSADLELPIPGLTPDVTAIRIGVRDIQNIPAEAQTLRAVLGGAGLQFFINPIKPDFFPENKFVLVIGAKP